jgi:N-methylhydantoinase A
VLLAADFHRTHERIHSIRNDNDLVEFSAWRVRAIGQVDSGPAPFGDGAAAGTPRVKGRRSVYLTETGAVADLPVYDGTTMPAGARLEGPAIIDEATTTILLPAASTARTDRAGNYLVTL